MERESYRMYLIRVRHASSTSRSGLPSDTRLLARSLSVQSPGGTDGNRLQPIGN